MACWLRVHHYYSVGGSVAKIGSGTEVGIGKHKLQAQHFDLHIPPKYQCKATKISLVLLPLAMH